MQTNTIKHMKQTILLLVTAAALAVCGSCHASPPADTPRTELPVVSHEILTPAPSLLPVAPVNAPFAVHYAVLTDTRFIVRASLPTVFASFDGVRKEQFSASATAYNLSGKGEQRTRFHSVAPFALVPVY